MHAERPVLLLAGGTGGHIFPALAVATELQRLGVPVSWLGSRAGMEAQLVPARGVDFHAIDIRALRGKGLQRLVAAPLQLTRALLQAARVVRQLRPRCVLSFGGYAAGPGGLAAWLAGIPLLVHEQNRAPGLTNRLLSRLANRVLCGFPGAFPDLPSVSVLGNPVRKDIAALPAPAQRQTDPAQTPRLLVLGGSQGARRLNELLPEALALLAPGSLQVRHQCGRLHADAAQQAYQRLGIDARVEAFIDDMAGAYAEADLVLARAGALTVSELCAAGVASLLVPYPHAVDDHQTRNGELLVEAGAAVMIQESALTAQRLAEALQPLLEAPELRLKMAEAARTLSPADAAANVAAICVAEGRT